MGRQLSYEEKQNLEAFVKLSAKDFEEQIAAHFNTYLKRQSDPKHAISIATYLAHFFPEYQPNAPRTPSNRVWEACERVLLLASGPTRMRPLELR
jgi:hypothetical protein